MGAVGTPTAKAAALLEDIRPELMRLLENAPLFGTAGLTLTLRDGKITSVDVAVSVKRRVNEDGSRT